MYWGLLHCYSCHFLWSLELTRAIDIYIVYLQVISLLRRGGVCRQLAEASRHWENINADVNNSGDMATALIIDYGLWEILPSCYTPSPYTPPLYEKHALIRPVRMRVIQPHAIHHLLCRVGPAHERCVISLKYMYRCTYNVSFISSMTPVLYKLYAMLP